MQGYIQDIKARRQYGPQESRRGTREENAQNMTMNDLDLMLILMMILMMEQLKVTVFYGDGDNVDDAPSYPENLLGKKDK